jgi:osmotically-inducible protein OsmY
MKRIATLLLFPLLALLAGCPAVIVGGGAAAVSAIEDRRTSGTMIDDDSIEVAVRQAVRERFGENTHVNVTSFNRSVLLTGEVPDEARKADVGKIAQGIANVRTVTNDLQIAAPTSFAARTNDSLITARVKTRLLDADKLNPLHVKVVTENGVVYLMGIVTEQEAADAVEIARTTSGVRKVVKMFEYCKPDDQVCRPRS